VTFHSTPRDLAMQDAAADISSMMPSGMVHGTGTYEKWVLGAIQRAFERHEVFSETVPNLPDGGPPEPWRSELIILTDVLSRAREALLVSIKGSPEDLQRSLGKLNLACKAHWDWQTERMQRESDLR
jgi:hypothetical protein